MAAPAEEVGSINIARSLPSLLEAVSGHKHYLVVQSLIILT